MHFAYPSLICKSSQLPMAESQKFSVFTPVFKHLRFNFIGRASFLLMKRGNLYAAAYAYSKLFI